MAESVLGELPEGVESAMFLRDGWPTVVCKAVLKDGRVGIGVYRHPDWSGSRPRPDDADAEAMRDALLNMNDAPPDYTAIHDHAAKMAAAARDRVQCTEEPDDDLQASLGQKAHQ